MVELRSEYPALRPLENDKWQGGMVVGSGGSKGVNGGGGGGEDWVREAEKKLGQMERSSEGECEV